MYNSNINAGNQDKIDTVHLYIYLAKFRQTSSDLCMSYTLIIVELQVRDIDKRSIFFHGMCFLAPWRVYFKILTEGGGGTGDSV